MTTAERRISQAGLLGVGVMACLSQLNVLWPGRIVKPLPDGPWWDLWYPALVAVVPGSAFVLAGLIGWSLRPGNLVGLLMMGVGVGLLTLQLSMGIYDSRPPVLQIPFYVGGRAHAIGV